ncbi:MAG: ATP-dependent DNA helicase RecG [Treponema sp.]|jgi:ATP-dependent DNA helicase RecG|nr:ATP-dependent DNA helicase RecG [Treponema sp.]
MFLRSLTVPVNSVKGVASSTVSKLAGLEIASVADLLSHYPRDWEDRTRKIPISGFNGAKVCTVVTVFAREWIGYGRMKTLKAYVEDETAQAVLLCFNRPWLEKQLVIGRQFRLWGRFYYKYGEIQSGSFEIEPLVSGAGQSRILPVYPLCAGLTQAALRRFTSHALEKYANDIEDELPAHIIERDNLLSKSEAIKTIHFPLSVEALEKAKKTLIYEELFYLEVMVGKRSLDRRIRKKIAPMKEAKEDTEYSIFQKKLIERLPFSLTGGQAAAIIEINRDMASNIPMARLLQGDVGSGKTMVAFMAALWAVEREGQAAIMAPTELLARQQADNAARLLEPLGLHVAFLTGNIKTAGRKELLKNLSTGTVDIVIGTHALFSKDVEYKNLKLVVIDEQHRFGVTQRSLIMAKGDSPGLLMMSATPIPRSLALTVFGDMDVSVIKDLPPGRKPVKTHLAKESNEKKVYDFVRGELEHGRQAYFVYPLIEQPNEQSNETLNEGGEDIKDAVSMADRLSKEVFPQYKVSLIHSKLSDDEKRQTMDDFRKGEVKILAATSVVEVGVDVPNATCMVVEHAERFGLSALHQLRGRVGRGVDQSYCFLVYSDDLGEDGKIRLKVMLENSDGFVIAEEDLKMRGPGQIAGTEQSGYLVLGIANPIRDIEELERARADAFAILERDSDLLLADNRVIAKVLEEAPPFAEVAF